MDKAKLFGSIVGLCVTLPIWFYLLYKVLVAVDATELMWFLYWVYVPAHFLVQILAKVVEGRD